MLSSRIQVREYDEHGLRIEWGVGAGGDGLQFDVKGSVYVYIFHHMSENFYAKEPGSRGDWLQRAQVKTNPQTMPSECSQ